MIELIIKNYFSIFLSVGVGALFLICVGLYFIFKLPPTKSTAKASPKTKPKTAVVPVIKGADNVADMVALTRPTHLKNSIDFNDIASIAGEDVITTQLDLAKAFIETGKQNDAAAILQVALTKGNNQQQAEARRLLGQ